MRLKPRSRTMSSQTQPAPVAVQFTRSELEPRRLRSNAVIVIDNVVYDVTEFLDEHPGGTEVLLDRAGGDASRCFHEVGHSEIALEWREKFRIGEVTEADRLPVEPRPQLGVPEDRNELTLSALLNAWGPPLLMALLAALFYSYLFQ